MSVAYPDLLLEKEKWHDPLEAMAAEVATMIQKFGDMVDEDVVMGLANET